VNSFHLSYSQQNIMLLVTDKTKYDIEYYIKVQIYDNIQSSEHKPKDIETLINTIKSSHADFKIKLLLFYDRNTAINNL